MLLRQALEQTRAGMPPPILFNSRMVGLEPIDEVSAMEDVFDGQFHSAHNRSGSKSCIVALPGSGSFRRCRTARLRPLSRERTHHEGTL